VASSITTIAKLSLMYAECCLFIVMMHIDKLNVIMVNVIKMYVFIMNVILLYVIIIKANVMIV
jgi:hypothetical protein